jgi:hypothetical protein
VQTNKEVDQEILTYYQDRLAMVKRVIQSLESIHPELRIPRVPKRPKSDPAIQPELPLGVPKDMLIMPAEQTVTYGESAEFDIFQANDGHGAC